MSLPLVADKFIKEALELLKPELVYPREIIVNKEHFNLKGRSFEIKQNLHVIGIGKASAFEVKAMKDFLKKTDLSSKLKTCLALTKEGDGVSDSEIIQWEGTHPVVSEKNVQNSKQFIERLKEIPEGDTLIFLVSGGTSALLEIPNEGTTFEELKRKNEELLASGLGINEMNQKRKELSLVKGGGLLTFIKTKEVIQLITCDVPNEDLDDVGSGPLLGAKANWKVPSFMMNSASVLLESLCQSEKREKGNVYDCSVEELITSLKKNLPKKGHFHISAGECPIKLPKKPGKGGRNTHFVLAMANELYRDPKNRDIHILSLATDGGDGPTDGAGAYINYELFDSGLAEKELEAYNSYVYFDKMKSLIKTGPTQTNVMDLRVIWRE